MDSKSLKFPIIDIVCENQPENSYLLYFITVSFNVLSFWRLDHNNRLDGFHVKFEDLTRSKEEDEIMTAIDISPYNENVKTSFILVGTNKGAILIIDKDKKLMLRKYYISKAPIIKIKFNKENIIFTSESPIVYCWKYDQSKITENYVFDFLQNEKPDLIFLDSNITSIDFKGFEVKNLINHLGISWNR